MRTPELSRAETQVNLTDQGAELDSTITYSANGGYVVGWSDSSGVMWGQRFDAAGNRIGGEVRMIGGNTVSGEHLVTKLDGSGYLVSYTYGTHSFVTHFNNSLTLVRTDTIEAGSNASSNSSISMLPTGGYVVTWTEMLSATSWQIMARFVTAAGTVGAPINISASTYREDFSQTAVLNNGNVVIVWEHPYQGSGTDHDIFYQIRSPTGALLGSTAVINGAGDGGFEALPDIVALANGGFVVVWQDGLNNADIHGTVYDRNGQVIRNEFVVNATTEGAQGEAHITAMADGSFLVAWEDYNLNQSRAQRFDQAGNMIGQEVVVHSATPVLRSEVVTLTDGRTAFAFNRYDNDWDITHSILDTRHNVTNMVSGANFVGVANGSADVLITNLNPSNNAAGGLLTLYSFRIEDNGLAGASEVGRVGAEWRVDGAGDFGRDGRSDVLISRDVGGQRILTELRMGENAVNGAFNLGQIGIDWQVSGFGDFDRDLDADIMISREFGGVQQFVLYRVENNAIVGSSGITTVGVNRVIDAVGDFDNDGDADVLLHVDTGGTRSLEVLRTGPGLTQTLSNIGSVGNDWQIVGAGDFNGDGDDDILMRGNTAGLQQLYVLGMQNGVVQKGFDLGYFSMSQQVGGIGDYDMDGDADLLFDGGNLNLSILDIQNYVGGSFHDVGSVGTEWLLT